MREIKFRAWNKNSEYMGNPFDLYEELTLDHMANNTGIWVKDTVFMQYTGLTDKAGVEIYEGDIVSYIPWGYVSPVKDVIEYNDKLAKYNIDRSVYGYEVIGNIYENKELLNDNL